MSDTNYQDTLPLGTLLKSGARTYKVEAVLGSGGFGTTYKVSSVLMVDKVPVVTFFALKEFYMKGCSRADDNATVTTPPSLKADFNAYRNDFLTEARRLNHLSGLSQNIVRVNEAFEANNTAYYVMQFLDGGTMSEHLDREGPLSEAKALSIIVPIAKAVQLIHKERLLHLDIKPDNIVLMTSQLDGTTYPVLIDFGIAKHFSSSGKPTSTHSSKGASDGYAPLEQYASIDSFSPETDVYALGATLLHFLSGRIPKKASDITRQDIENAIPQEVSKATRNAIVKAMAMIRSERTPSVQAFLDSLEGEYTLPLGFLLSSGRFTYRITGIAEENPSFIVYHALPADLDSNEENNLSDGGNHNPIDDGNHNPSNQTRRISSRNATATLPIGREKSAPAEGEALRSFMVYELYSKRVSKRNDDGSVTGSSTMAERDFQKAYDSVIPKNSLNKLSVNGYPMAESFRANGTLYFAYLLIPKPSAIEAAKDKLSALGSSAQIVLRKSVKPLAYILGGAAVVAGLYFGGKAVAGLFSGSDKQPVANNVETPKTESSDSLSESTTQTEQKDTTQRDTMHMTPPKPDQPVSPVVEVPPAPKPEPTNDERYEEAVRRKDYSTLLSLAASGYAKAFYDAANYYFNQKDYGNAKTYAQKAISANVNKKNAQSLIAKIDNILKPQPEPQPQSQPVAAQKTDAQLLEEAKAKGDWAAVKRLADSGYKQALVPLAANYARTGRYDDADRYAQKAKSNGIKDANDVINYLNDLGYYDDKK